MSDQARTASRPWRKRLRFSLRGLIVLVFVLAIWLGSLVRSAHTQRDSVAAIRSAGGVVLYDWEWHDGGFVSGNSRRPRRPAVELIGVDYFGHVTSVVFRESRASNAAAASIARLTQLERLALFGSSFDNAGMAHLKGLAGLSELTLVGTPITDEGLIHLNELSKLSELNLVSTRITDAGLVHLKRLTSLSKLSLSHSQITDAGLVHLKRLTNLSELSLSGTKVTDAGVKELQRALPSLKIYETDRRKARKRP